MLGTDYSWVSDKLKEFGYSDSKIEKSVVELLHTLDAQNPKDVVERNVIADLFKYMVEDSDVSHEVQASTWTDFVLGVTVSGVTARVRADAYSGAGSKHNGLVGTIVGIRGGRVYLQYTGRSDGIGHAHHPDFIEVLVK